MVNNPTTLLTINIDPMLKETSSETPVIGGPLLSILKKTILTGVEVPVSNILELAQPYSIPVVQVGDTWVYSPMQSQLATGRVKFKKFTLQSAVSEDELDRMINSGDASILSIMKGDELKTGILYLQGIIAGFICDPWLGVTTSTYYDANIIGLFTGSNGGTISNPSDLNSTAGTALATGLSVSGANQSTRVVDQVAAAIKKGFVKLDAKLNLRIPVRKIYAGVNPLMKTIFDTTRDILDATSGYRSPNNMTEDFAKHGITLVEDVGFDSAYVGAEDGLAYMRCFADPEMDFELLGIKPKEGDAWTNWAERQGNDAKEMTLWYEKHKKIEIGARAHAYGLNAAATSTSLTYYKKVWNCTVIGYNNV